MTIASNKIIVGLCFIACILFISRGETEKDHIRSKKNLVTTHQDNQVPSTHAVLVGLKQVPPSPPLQKPPQTTPGAYKRGAARVYSPQTELNYNVEFYLDSLIKVRYETSDQTYIADLPSDVFRIIYKADSALRVSQNVPVDDETVAEAYIDAEEGILRLHLFKELNLWIALSVLLLGLMGSVAWPVSKRLRRIEQERSALKAARQLRIEAQEKERFELASALHDGPVHIIQQVLKDADCPEEGDTTEAQTCKQLRKVNNDLRDLCKELRPHVLVHFGLDEAINAHIRSFRTMHPNLQFVLNLDKEDCKLPQQPRLDLYRITQEALNNIVKHASAKLVEITLSLTDANTTLIIKDDGAGFNPPQDMIDLEIAGHMGLATIAARAEKQDGTLTIKSKPGNGTVLTIELSTSKV